MELEEIGTLLASEGFSVDMGSVNMSGEVVPQLSVRINLDGQEEENALSLELLFIPGLKNEFDGCQLLQLFIGYSESLEEYAPEKVEELALTLSELNFNAPLGAFGIRDANQLLFYKHMMMVPGDMSAETETVISETVWLITFVQNQCYPVIASVLEGTED